MVRQLRHHYAGGWYHITTRGMGRREVFLEDRDRGHMEGEMQMYNVERPQNGSRKGE